MGTDHAIWTLTMLSGYWPCYLDTDHATRTLTMLCGHWPCYLDTDHAIWTLTMLYGHWPCYLGTGHAIRTLTMHVFLEMALFMARTSTLLVWGSIGTCLIFIRNILAAWRETSRTALKTRPCKCQVMPREFVYTVAWNQYTPTRPLQTHLDTTHC
jgi:hypothetical protein